MIRPNPYLLAAKKNGDALHHWGRPKDQQQCGAGRSPVTVFVERRRGAQLRQHDMKCIRIMVVPMRVGRSRTM
jgi:hypothetical protein